MAYEVEEKVFTTVEDACLKVVRTFTIINWCKYEAGGETVSISRTENEHGMVTAEQKTFSITATDCNEQSTATLKYNWKLYQFQNDEIIAKGTGSTFTRTVSPSDRFVVEWEVADNCGNVGTATANHYFVDCKKPVPYCLHGVAVELMSDAGTIQIWASDIDAGSTDNCTCERYDYGLEVKNSRKSNGSSGKNTDQYY